MTRLPTRHPWTIVWVGTYGFVIEGLAVRADALIQHASGYPQSSL